MRGGCDRRTGVPQSGCKTNRLSDDDVNDDYTPPTAGTDAFHCPNPSCGVYAHQVWGTPVSNMDSGGSRNIDGLRVSYCSRCNGYALWLNHNMLYPAVSAAPPASADTPEDVALDYGEARDIVSRSPRAACALLRLALQKLMPHLGEGGKDLNRDIGALVKKGLPELLQQALDGLRVIGNNAVHPGEIDLKDDSETALALFHILNTIVDVMITQPKRVENVYSKIPGTVKDAIARRDSTEPS